MLLQFLLLLASALAVAIQLLPALPQFAVVWWRAAAAPAALPTTVASILCAVCWVNASAAWVCVCLPFLHRH